MSWALTKYQTLPEYVMFIILFYSHNNFLKKYCQAI